MKTLIAAMMLATVSTAAVAQTFTFKANNLTTGEETVFWETADKEECYFVLDLAKIIIIDDGTRILKTISKPSGTLAYFVNDPNYDEYLIVGCIANGD